MPVRRQCRDLRASDQSIDPGGLESWRRLTQHDRPRNSATVPVLAPVTTRQAATPPVPIHARRFVAAQAADIRLRIVVLAAAGTRKPHLALAGVGLHDSPFPES